MAIPRPPNAQLPAAPEPPPGPKSTNPDVPKTLANGRPVLNSADAYWATQPPEVQVLQNMRTEQERSDKAHELADQGYLIDVPIMLWGWDPLATMVVRRNQGYTWVPSAKQAPVQVCPGLTFPGLPSYDADHAPAGSIKVSTDFAAGLWETDPWLRAEGVTS